ncbi:rhomboid family intramembrane serine protease [Halorubrum coriense]|uniref:rhomboid family intramembrane serine protease n=1 Tax=Halorubrum coriense TaxID=64713 RepID=UPI0009B5BE3D|nr:rhomboid family intramembrane serine protease [Halorubrum coriense]
MSLLDKLKTHPPTVTIGFTIIFLGMYTAQILAVGGPSQDAGFQAVKLVTNTLDAGAVLFTWLLHSNHTHIGGNVVVFFATGWVIEDRVDRDRFIFATVFLLGMGVNLVYFILFRGAGVGISGITTGLVTMIALGSLEGLFDFDNLASIYFAIWALSTLYLLYSVEVIGQLPSGTAVEAHILGSGFAVAWYTTERYQYGAEYRLK